MPRRKRRCIAIDRQDPIRTEGGIDDEANILNVFDDATDLNEAPTLHVTGHGDMLACASTQ